MGTVKTTIKDIRNDEVQMKVEEITPEDLTTTYNKVCTLNDSELYTELVNAIGALKTSESKTITELMKTPVNAHLTNISALEWGLPHYSNLFTNFWQEVKNCICNDYAKIAMITNGEDTVTTEVNKIMPLVKGYVGTICGTITTSLATPVCTIITCITQLIVKYGLPAFCENQKPE